MTTASTSSSTWPRPIPPAAMARLLGFPEADAKEYYQWARWAAGGSRRRRPTARASRRRTSNPEQRRVRRRQDPGTPGTATRRVARGRPHPVPRDRGRGRAARTTEHPGADHVHDRCWERHDEEPHRQSPLPTRSRSRMRTPRCARTRASSTSRSRKRCAWTRPHSSWCAPAARRGARGHAGRGRHEGVHVHRIRESRRDEVRRSPTRSGSTGRHESTCRSDRGRTSVRARPSPASRSGRCLHEFTKRIAAFRLVDPDHYDPLPTYMLQGQRSLRIVVEPATD